MFHLLCLLENRLILKRPLRIGKRDFEIELRNEMLVQNETIYQGTNLYQTSLGFCSQEKKFLNIPILCIIITLSLCATVSSVSLIFQLYFFFIRPMTLSVLLKMHSALSTYLIYFYIFAIYNFSETLVFWTKITLFFCQQITM